MGKTRKNPSIPPSLDREMSFNRYRDALVIIPWIALTILLSPVLNFIDPEVIWWGIPARVIQLLCAWIGLIVLVYFINRGLKSAIASRDQ